MKNARRGFTIVEMLAVIGVIAVLMTIVVTAAAGSIKSSRSKRADIMRNSLEQGIAAYYAQEGKWPKLIEDVDTSGDDTFEFKDAKADQIFREVVGKGFGHGGRKSMLVDASALFVCESSAANGNKAHGYEFSEVTGKNAKHRIDISRMAFGYQDPSTGRFRRFYVVYNCRTDIVTVGPKLSSN